LINEQHLSVSIPSLIEQVHSPICMPYSESESENNHDMIKQPNLHGAPMARKSKRTVYLPELLSQVDKTIENLKTSPKHREFVNGNFITKLKSYYENDSAGSILSIPIYKFMMEDIQAKDWPQQDGDKIACILNIYANKNNLFANEEMANAFSDLTRPICYVFSVLVSLRLATAELRSKLPKSNATQVQSERGQYSQSNMATQKQSEVVVNASFQIFER
jgi:hypothetical protein